MANLNLKGIWIPIEILTDDKLSDKEKIIYALVIYLSKENQYCFLTNTEVDMRKLIPIEEKFKDNKYNINKYKNNNKEYCNYDNEIMKKKALSGIAYMQIIILMRKLTNKILLSLELIYII